MAMDPGHNEDLERIVLCKHGKACQYRARGTCGFAHALAELLPPREVVYSYKGSWSDGVDRWYGQHLFKRQIARIREYYKSEAEHERPVWAKGLCWFLTNKPLKEYLSCPWDFGIWQDLDTVKRCRKHSERPFQYWAVREDGTDIWTALLARRDAFARGIPPPPPLPGPAVALDGIQTTFQALVAPDGIPQTPLASDPQASDSMSQVEPQSGPVGGMLAVTPHHEEVSQASEGMSELSEPQQGRFAGGMEAETRHAAVGSGGMTLDNFDTMSEGMHSVMTGGISESMDAVLMAEPFVQASGQSILVHGRWKRRDIYPAENDYEYDQ